MNNTSIAFLDSGIGGLPYLEWVRKNRPNLSLSYLADNLNFPYGELDENRVREVAIATAKHLYSRLSPDIIAVVCNTASVTALEDIRKVVPCPVVGTVPALKLAAGRGIGSIGLLATEGTVKSAYVDRLISTFAPKRKVIRVAAGNIVRYVEEEWLEHGNRGAEKIMKKGLTTLYNAGVESIVIGCTHFLHVMEPIRKLMGDVTVVDSLEGVGQRILHLSEEGTSHTSDNFFFVSQRGAEELRYQRFAKLFGLQWGGLLS